MKRTHGMSNTTIYRKWHDIKRRCSDSRQPSYKNYGGRGIEMCEEWKNDFAKFYEYVSSLPNFNKPEYTLDRINNDGNYEPGNVRWATRLQQSRNRRPYKNYVWLTYEGEKMCLAAMAKKYGIKEVTVRARYVRGLPIDMVLYQGDLRHNGNRWREKLGPTDNTNPEDRADQVQL